MRLAHLTGSPLTPCQPLWQSDEMPYWLRLGLRKGWDNSLEYSSRILGKPASLGDTEACYQTVTLVTLPMAHRYMTLTRSWPQFQLTHSSSIPGRDSLPVTNEETMVPFGIPLGTV